MEVRIRQRKRVVVAMSGGVDSSVSAALLVDEGYEVIGVTMKLWNYDELGDHINRESGCCSLDTIQDARAVCSQIGAPHYVWDLSEEFGKAVIDNFVSEYLEGRTPNPCVMCNKHIKWGTFLGKARSLGADLVATGHYARVVADETTGRYRLLKSPHARKDQSYALWGIRQKALAVTLFPVGELTKDEVREVAERKGLRTAKKKESQEICFVTDNDYGRFLNDRVAAMGKRLAQGEIKTSDGTVVGGHDGYAFYTIGQRRGVGVSLNRPVYVTEIRARDNVIYVGPQEELYARGLTANEVNLIRHESLDGPMAVTAKIRYNDPGHPAVLAPLPNGEVQLEFQELQRAITPGQSVVFYQDDEVLGGGLIDRVLRDVPEPV